MYYKVNNRAQVEGYIASCTSKGRKKSVKEIISFLTEYYGASVEMVPEGQSILQNFTDEFLLRGAEKFKEERILLTETGMQYPEDGNEFDRWYSDRHPRYNN